MKTSNTLKKLYTVVSIIILIALAFCVVFPLYWIVTGAFKTPVSINSPVPDWIPKIGRASCRERVLRLV